MSLIKTIVLPSGYTAEYIRLDSFRWERANREVSASFQVYKDAASATVGEPATPKIIRLRVVGPAFTQYFGPVALANANQDIISLLYAALKQTSGMTSTAARNAGLFLITDFGHDALQGSVDG